MNTLQPEETAIIIKHFNIGINKNGTNVKLSLKPEYKNGKDVPIKKIRDNGQKVAECGIKYYQHYLGDSVGTKVYSIRKKLFNMYTLIPWVIDLPTTSESDKQFLSSRVSEMLRKNSAGLLSHYASPDGIETKKKLKCRNEKWTPVIAKMASDMWKTPGYMETEMKRRHETGMYARSGKTHMENYSDPEFRAKMLVHQNKPTRVKLISDAAKKMWKRAKDSDHALFRRMTISCGRKNFDVDGIKMNSIEYMIATGLNSLGIAWEYGIPVAVGKNTYIPDFIIKNTNLVIECNGDYWHANPSVFGENHQIRKGLTAKKIWSRDARKLDDLTSAGYTCLIFWESEINANLENVKQQILNEYDKTRK